MRLAVFISVLLLIVVGFYTVSRSQIVYAATNSTINFQARLLTAAGNVVPDGQYNVEFKLYNALSSTGSSQGSCSGDAACLWTETRLTSNKVRVVNGYLTVNLGSVTAFASTINWDQELWLTMNIGGTGSASWDGEMTPRLKLTAVPYAFRAGRLANTNGANLSTLGWATQTASNSILLPNEAGTLCIQNSTNCGFLTSGTGNASYIQNNATTTPQTAHFNIQGTNTTTNTATIRSVLNQDNDLLQFQSSTGTPQAGIRPSGAIYSAAVSNPVTDVPANARLFVQPVSNTSTAIIARAASGGAPTGDILQLQTANGATNVFTVGVAGATTVNNSSPSALLVQNTSGVAALTVDTSNTRVGIGATPTYKLDVAGDVNISTGSAYKINGTNICTASGCTPAAGSSNYIQNTATVQTNANIAIQSAADASISLYIKERATQSADLIKVVTNDDATIFRIDAFGGAQFSQKVEIGQTLGVGVSPDSGVGILVAAANDSQIGLHISAIASGHTGDLMQLHGPLGRTATYTATGTLAVKGGSTQSADLFSLQNSSSAMLASFTSTGNLTFGNTADKTISITQAGSGNHGNVLTLQAGSGNGTNRNGGNLLLQGGNSTGTGTPGSVIVRPQTNTTTAFQVQNAAGTTTVLNADTTNTRVGIGTNAPLSTLHVVSNNAAAGQNIGVMIQGAQSVASAAEQFALYSNPTYTAASGTLLALTGGYFHPQNTGGGTVTTMRAGLFKAENTGAGAVTDMVGVGSYITKVGTGNTTNAYGLVTRIENGNATGTITNAYGLYIDNSIETGTITNDYGVYQVDPGAQNQFFGAVNVTNTSTTALRVQNASSADIFNVNTSSNAVNIGSASQTVNLSLTGDVTWGAQLETPQGFEDATFVPASPGTWSTGGNVNWARTTTDFQVGTASAASGTIGHSQSSWLDLNYTFAEAGFFSFYWKVSSEADFDYLSFCVDDDTNCDIDTAYTRISGTSGWAKVSVAVTAGAHSFRWEYNKDSGVAAGSDKGWVDNVQFTGSGGTGTLRGNALTFLAGDTLSFQTSANANALYIDSSGRVGISTASPTEALTVLGNVSIRDSGLAKQFRFRTSGAALDFEGAAADLYISTWTGAGFTGTQTTHMIFDDAGGTMRFPSLPTAPATGYTNVCVENTANREIRRSTSATTCATSSVRYKENVVNLSEQMGLDTIMALRPVSYNYKIDPGKKSKIGFIAEEVNGVLPQIVNYNDQGQIDSLDYEYLVANLVKGIQQQQVQINNIRQGVWDGGLVARDSSFNGLVAFNAGVTFKSDATFEGKVNFKNKITYNEDTAGTAIIPKGQTKVEVRFKQPYERAPFVALGASEFTSIKVTDKSAEGFTIVIKSVQAKDITVDWVATQITAQPSP